MKTNTKLDVMVSGKTEHISIRYSQPWLVLPLPATLTSHVNPPLCSQTHLGVTESQEVHRQVGLNAIDGSGQSDSAEQQHSQDHIGHRGCDPHNLKRWHKVHTHSQSHTYCVHACRQGSGNESLLFQHSKWSLFRWIRRRSSFFFISLKILCVLNGVNLPKDSRIGIFFMLISYLSRGLDTLPETKVEQNNHHTQTGSQLPARPSQIIDSVTVLNVEHRSSKEREHPWPSLNHCLQWV